jgi:hypothetical protein
MLPSFLRKSEKSSRRGRGRRFDSLVAKPCVIGHKIINKIGASEFVYGEINFNGRNWVKLIE